MNRPTRLIIWGTRYFGRTGTDFPLNDDGGTTLASGETV
jgi:hypothetical protein